MLWITLVLVTGLCLALPLTRIYGIACTVMLLYFYPYHTLTLLALAGVAFIYFKYRGSHA